MIRSMTGFGEAQQQFGERLLRVQIKTVNHRFLNCSVRTPAGFDRFEHEVQGWLRPFLHRGHATVAITLDRPEGAPDDDLPRADARRAKHYVDELRRMADELGLSGQPDVSMLLRFSDVFRSPDGRTEQPDVSSQQLAAVVEAAARDLVRMREVEGARMQLDLQGRLDAISTQLTRVEGRAPTRLQAERDRLRAQIQDLAQSTEVDEDRLAREVAYLAEKWDINEEIVRFRSHVELFRETLDVGGSEAVGKRLSFVVQEMHREANTIGSKANDAEIAHASVAMKEEIERLREQVENIE
jgi:uncharacterized protein (TIGR00255 family)